MKVKLQNDWFGPSIAKRIGSGHIDLKVSGRMYRGPQGPEQGIHEFPEEMRGHLPKSAIILDDEKETVVPYRSKKQESLKDYDADRAASDALVAATEKAEKDK